MTDFNFEAMVRYRRGTDLHDLMDALIVEGCEPKAAEDAVMKVHNRIKNRDRKRGFTNLCFGLLIFVVGGGVTLWTMKKGMVIAVAYSALLVGAGMAATGAMQIVKAGKDRELARVTPLSL